MWEMPDHKDPLKPIGMEDVDQKIEDLVESLKASYEVFLAGDPGERQAVLMSVEIQLRDDPAVESEDEFYDVVFSEEGSIWTRYRSDSAEGWAPHDVSYFDSNYGARYWMRQLIKDFLNYRVVLDEDADRNPTVEIGEISQWSVIPKFKDTDHFMQTVLEVPKILVDYETLPKPPTKDRP